MTEDFDPTIVAILKAEIVSRIKELLEQKHLYQSVRIDTSQADKAIEDYVESQENERRQSPAFVGASSSWGPAQAIYIEVQRKLRTDTIERLLASPWSFRTDECLQLAEAQGDMGGCNAPNVFPLPTINIKCTQCDSVLPAHNSGFRGLKHDLTHITYPKQKNGSIVPCQTFFFPYQCQSCKQEALVFLVRREGSKLTLAGRNHFETVDVPKTLPKQEREYYSDAVVAYNTGNILAGLFLLRTTIEQYMRRILGVQAKMSGEDLADQYAKLLV